MSARGGAWVGTGTTQHIAPGGVDRTPEYDPRSGDHLWTVVSMYRVDPTKASDPTASVFLDTETLLHIAGPGCFYCEQPYSPRLLHRRCPGKPVDE